MASAEYDVLKIGAMRKVLLLENPKTPRYNKPNKTNLTYPNHSIQRYIIYALHMRGCHCPIF